VDYATGAAPYSVAIGDLDADDDLDLTTADRASNTVSVLLNNGDGTFADKMDYETGAEPLFVAIGDLDSDDDLDLAVANYSSNNVSVLLNNLNN
jgi:hypothetical protein